jgi:hypothetical protein
MTAINRDRKTVTDAIRLLFGLRATDELILTPSTGVALRLVLRALGIRDVFRTREEYFAREHFPGSRVRTLASTSAMQPRARSRQACLLTSPVSWRGVLQRTPTVKTSTAILIVDAAHVGALGFPYRPPQPAKIVVGDLNKWWLGSHAPACGFVAVHSSKLRPLLRREFATLYLATDSTRLSRASRWLEPDAVGRVASEIRRTTLRRAILRQRADENLALARRVAEMLDLPAPASSILLLPRSRAALKLPFGLERSRLVWTLPDGSRRIVCRADSLRSARS